MAMTAPARFQIFPKQPRIKTAAHSLWTDPETQLNELMDAMEKNPIPATPVTKSGASRHDMKRARRK